MATNLALGTLLISATVVVHTLGLVLLARWMSWIVRWFRLHQHDLGKIVAMVTTAYAYIATGVVAELEEAVYFSTVTFSTLGYGDITAPPSWRVLAALEAMDGIILIGWSIAYLVAASTRHGPFRIGEHF